MQLVREFGACDCHGHVYGPFQRFPLPRNPVFEASGAPLAQLEIVWARFGFDRAVLVQGSAYGDDHTALLAAIAHSPVSRRGVALLKPDVAEETIWALDQGGIRATRLNWVHHLFADQARSRAERLADAARLLKKIAPFGWHVEVHLTPADLDAVNELDVPDGMRIVIDHMARIDMSAPEASSELERLIRLLEQDRIWVKLSGADRLAAKCEDVGIALGPMREIIATTPGRCIWGLDWPHVNLEKKREDAELVDLLVQAAGSERALARILVENPATLYGFADATAQFEPTSDESLMIPGRATAVR